MKDYQKPEFEVITLVAQEETTLNEGITDHESSIF